MVGFIQKEWRKMCRGQPGRRFQDRYARCHDGAKPSKQGVRRRALRLVLGGVLFVIGVVLIFIPGPAILFFLASGGLLASESKWVARWLDWLELHLWAVWDWMVRRWSALSVGGRTGVICLLVIGAGASVYVSYHLVME